MFVSQVKSGHGFICKLQCDYCSKIFKRSYSAYKLTKNNFCSWICRNLWSRNTGNPNFMFNKFITQEECYWLGYLYADGCMIHDKKGYYKVVLNCSGKDKQHLLKFSNFTGYNLRSYKMYDKRTNKFYVRIEVAITKQKDCLKILEMGMIPRKSHQSLSIPKILKPMIHHFIRGYFDGDGCIRFHKSSRLLEVKISNGHPQILQEIASYLRPITSSKMLIKKHKESECYIFACRSNWMCKLIGDFLYKNSHIHLERKKELFDK